MKNVCVYSVWCSCYFTLNLLLLSGVNKQKISRNVNRQIMLLQSSCLSTIHIKTSVSILTEVEFKVTSCSGHFLSDFPNQKPVPYTDKNLSLYLCLEHENKKRMILNMASTFSVPLYDSSDKLQFTTGDVYFLVEKTTATGSPR